ncbi:MAG: hypothetical protein FJ297_06695 [Planctomycetes bacterium]|nr:hypothetical protein [Planctomycetota bacterium]
MGIRVGWNTAVLAAVCCWAAVAQAQFAPPPSGYPAMPGMMPSGMMPSGMMLPGALPPGAAPYMMAAPMFADPASFPVQQAAAMNMGAACSECGNNGHCATCDECCPGGSWCYDFAVFADFLYLRSRDSEIAYAVEVNSATAPPTVPVQVGRVGVADMDYQPAWRAGFTYVLDDCSTLTAQYTMFEGNTNSRTDLTSGILGAEVQSMLFHPNTVAASTGGLYADAAYNMSFDLIDLDYRELIWYDCFQQTNFLVGLRYANLEQQLLHQLPVNGTHSVATDIDIDAIGGRCGLETVRYSPRGLLAYARGYGSLLVGDFSATYDQTDTFDTSVVSTAWKAGRTVPILDLEAGIGWTSANGYWRLTAGYLHSVWFNTVTTDEFIKAVQSNNFAGLGGDGITFDGLVGRIEARF